MGSGYRTRTFIVVKGSIKRIGVDRFSRIGSERMPEYAGQKVPYALLVFESEPGGLGALRYCEGGYLVFDELGNMDERSQWNHIRLAREGENDPGSFAARRGEQLRKESTWHPTGEQLEQMLALLKRKG